MCERIPERHRGISIRVGVALPTSQWMPTAEGQARDQSYCYHATTRRLEFLRAASGGCPGGAAQVYFDFDEQGNLKNKNGQGYLFSQDNRLREAVGKERYHYDANGAASNPSTAVSTSGRSTARPGNCSTSRMGAGATAARMSTLRAAWWRPASRHGAER